MPDADLMIRGAGGKSSSSYSAPVEDPNTLQSQQIVTIVEAVSEGPIVGLATGDAHSIAINETPLMASSGAYAYEDVSWAVTLGTADQAVLPGIDGIESEQSVSVEVTQYYPRGVAGTSGAVSRVISNAACTHVRITLGVQALYETLVDDADTAGDIVKATVSYRISITDGSGNTTSYPDVTKYDKTTSGAQWATKIKLPGSAPWTVRVEKTSADSDSSYLNNDLYWYSYTEIVGYQLTYPHTACVKLSGSAETFGNSIPERAYKIKGRIISVPSNYDPGTRAYDGVWDGTFKSAWSDNPAWVFLDMATHDRYGLAKYYPAMFREWSELCDKWYLYEIARLCDEMVDDGFGGTEPRFAFNQQITGQGTAAEVLQSMASVFHGLTYWGSGQVFARGDYPSDPVRTLTQANVIDGLFSYATSSQLEMHSCALVTWYDPENHGNTAIEPVYDWAKYRRLGYRPIDVTAYGTTSRGQAHRWGQWILTTEDDFWTCTCSVGMDSLDLVPGDIVRIADPNWMGLRYSGRLHSADGTTLVLDSDVELSPDETYSISVYMPDGSECTRSITSTGTSATLTIASALSDTPVDAAVWSISSSSVAPRTFRVQKIEEEDKHQAKLTLYEYNSSKYLEIESGLVLKETPGRIPTKGALSPPASAGLSVVESTYTVNGALYQRITFSWPSSGDADVSAYEAKYTTPTGTVVSFSAQKNYSIEVSGASSGTYVFGVRSVALDGRTSSWVEKSYTATGSTRIPSAPSGLSAVGGLKQITVSWTIPSDASLGYVEVMRNRTSDDANGAVVIAKLYASTYTDSGLSSLETCWYWVRSVDITEQYRSSMVGPVSGTTSQIQMEDVPEASITESKLIGSLTERIDAVAPIDTETGEIDWATGLVASLGTLRDVTVPDLDAIVQTVVAEMIPDIENSIDIATNRIAEIGDIEIPALETSVNAATGAAIDASEIVQSAADTVSEAVLQLSLLASDTRNVIRDASISVDPASGTVTIGAVQELRTEIGMQMTDLQVTVDAQAGQIEQRATYADVDERIAGAVFGDAGELLLSGVDARVNEVSSTLDAIAATVDLKASQTEVSALGATVSAAEENIDGINAALALKASYSDLSTLAGDIELELQSVALEMDAKAGTIAESIVDTKTGYGTAEEAAAALLAGLTAQANADVSRRQDLAVATSQLRAKIDENNEAVSSSIETLGSQLAGNVAALETERETRASELEAEAAARQTLAAEVGDVKAAIHTESSVRASANESLASQIATLESTITAGDSALSAAITTEQNTRATSDASNAALIQTVRADLTTETSARQAAVQTETQARTASDSSLGARIDTVTASLGTATSELAASIEAEETARVTAVAAEATARQTLASRVDNNEAAIQTEQSARSTAIAAEASRVNSIIARVDGDISDVSAGLQEEVTTRVSAMDAEVAARETLEATVEGHTAAIETLESTISDADSAQASRTETLIAKMQTDAESDAAAEAILAGITGAAKADSARRSDLALVQKQTEAKIQEGVEATAAVTELLAAQIGENQAAILEEQNVRASKDEAAAESTYAMVASLSETIAAGISESRSAIATSEAATASSLLAMSGQIDDMDAALSEEKEIRATADAATVSSAETLVARSSESDESGTSADALLAGLVGSAKADQSRRDDLAVAQRQLYANIIDGQEATASELQVLGSRIDDNVSAIAEESIARTDALETEAAKRESLESSFSVATRTLSAQIVNEISARSTAVSSEAKRVNQLIAGVDADPDLVDSSGNPTTVQGLISETADVAASATAASAYNANQIQAVVGSVYQSGLFVNRPAANTLAIGTIWVCTDADGTDYFGKVYRVHKTIIGVIRWEEFAGFVGFSYSAIRDEETTRADQTEALSERISRVWAQLGDEEATPNGQTVYAGISATKTAVARKATITTSDSAPASPGHGDLWCDTSGSADVWKRYNALATTPAWEILADSDISKFLATAYAKWTLRLDVNNHIIGIGMINDGSTGEFTVVADRFYVYGTGSDPVQIFSVDSTTGQAIFDADLFVRSADGITERWIRGDKIAADSVIQLGAGGKMLLGNGSILQMGTSLTSDSIILMDVSGATPRILAGNPSSATALYYSLITNGKITQYVRPQSGANGWVEQKSLGKVVTGTATNGASVQVDGYWRAKPSTLISPRLLQCYHKDYPSNNQDFDFAVTDEAWDASTMKYSFKPMARLVIPSGTNTQGAIGWTRGAPVHYGTATITLCDLAVPHGATMVNFDAIKISLKAVKIEVVTGAHTWYQYFLWNCKYSVSINSLIKFSGIQQHESTDDYLDHDYTSYQYNILNLGGYSMITEGLSNIKIELTVDISYTAPDWGSNEWGNWTGDINRDNYGYHENYNKEGIWGYVGTPTFSLPGTTVLATGTVNYLTVGE